MDRKDVLLLDKLEYDFARSEDIVLDYAMHNLDEFYAKWGFKRYSDSDYNLPNMLMDFIDAMEKKIKE